MINQFDRNKILGHLEYVNSYVQYGYTLAPITVEFDLTNICNHDCPGCSGFRDLGGGNSTIETEDTMEIMRDMHECGVKAITFTGGGDPTMHKDFSKLVSFAFHTGMEVGLITNGLSLKKDHLKHLIPACKWIRVSWDAATPELHDKIHYNGDLNIKMLSDNKFWQVVNNTKMLVEYKNANKYDTTIGCAFLVGPETKHEIKLFAELASKAGVNYCQYRPFHYIENDSEYEKLMLASRCKYQRDDFSVLFSEFKFNSLRSDDVARTYSYCHGSHFVTHIAANYNIYVCCHLMDTKGACIGNLKDKSFTEIWRNSKQKEVIGSIDVSKCLSLCRSDSANRLVDVMVNSKNTQHPNFL